MNNNPGNLGNNSQNMYNNGQAPDSNNSQMYAQVNGHVSPIGKLNTQQNNV
jgi:hypothetical protein